jgi:hypothetical protein
MALSELGLSHLSPRYLHKRREIYAEKTKFTEQELVDMMITTPPELTEENPIQTPAGVWSIDEGIAVFDSKSAMELNKITLPDRSLRRKLFKVAKVVFQIS